MKIGEFAKICGTKISVLRHYDKEKLLVPEYTDVFSGYRYYSSGQIAIFHRISALKKAGFTLQEIRQIISFSVTEKEISQMFARKEKELRLAIEFLKEAKLIMSELNVVFENDIAKVKIENKEKAIDVCAQLDSSIKNADLQRVSQFRISGEEISCRVIKLGEDVELPRPDMPFVDDPDVVGKWEVVGNYAVPEDYEEGIFCTMGFYGEDVKHIYFLPEGQKYWTFSWTKGYFISPVYNEYQLVEKDDGLYMLITLREFEGSRGGEPTLLVLRKIDSRKYTAEEIARKDDINKPFVTDERIIGKWRAHSFLREKSEFPAEEEPLEDLYFKEVELFCGGSCRCVYEDEVFEGDDKVTWTKNYLLRKWNWSACEYEIRTLNGMDYMIIEWKSGDYRYGGYDTNYYVFVRA